MIQACFRLFGLLWVGESLVRFLNLPIPGSIVGMVLLTGCLRLGIVRVEEVTPAADPLLDNLAFLFVPPGVGLMLHFDVLREEWPAVTAAFVLSSLAVLAAVGLLHQALEKRRSKP